MSFLLNVNGIGMLNSVSLFASVLLLLVLSACDDTGDAAMQGEAPVRGLVTTIVNAAEDSTQRRYPGVVEPAAITSLSFEVSGKLTELNLSVGQRVTQGDVLAQLDDEQFRTEIETQTAAVEEATTTFNQERADLGRMQQLLKKGVVTRVARDNARSDFQRARAQLTQAQKALEAANEDLSDTTLEAPFDGIINSVDADSFATVSAGAAIASLYSASAYEVSFSVNFDVVSRLVVGTPAEIRLADEPSIVLDGVVSELGERADTVSSFPVVVTLREDHPLIRAGMSVEVGLQFKIQAAQGYLIPLSAAVMEGQIPPDSGPQAVVDLEVYVFDEASSTVTRRPITMAGIRGNKFLVIDGLEPGEHVATAGVSFLREGMKVKLLPPQE